MEDLVLFKKKITSYIEKAYTGGVSLLPFLDDAQISIIAKELKWHNGIKFISDGGIENSSRVRYIICPEDLNKLDFKIVVYKVIYNKKYYNINHRNVLGSLMSLGIKRECIGDIVITDDNDVYFACTKEISSFIEEEFNFIGRTPIELEEYNGLVQNVLKYDHKLYFLASLRLDAAVASVYNISRAMALESIANGLVYINYVLIQNPSHLLKINDEVSVRHKGKFKVTEIGNITKSGRLAVTLSKRI